MRQLSTEQKVNIMWNGLRIGGGLTLALLLLHVLFTAIQWIANGNGVAR